MPDFCEISVDLNIRDYAQVTRDAVQDMADALEASSRADIAASGSGFGRFARQTRVRVTSLGDGNWQVGVFVRPSFLRVFEYGGTSIGRPMLWIPIARFTGARSLNVPASRSLRKLFRPPGTNILVSSDRVVRYVGTRQISNQKRFGLSDIAEQEANQFLSRLQA